VVSGSVTGDATVVTLLEHEYNLSFIQLDFIRGYRDRSSRERGERRAGAQCSAAVRIARLGEQLSSGLHRAQRKRSTTDTYIRTYLRIYSRLEKNIKNNNRAPHTS